MQFSPLPDTPGVSYVMPVLNEAGHLERSVRTILAQEYGGPQEIVLALGPSTDNTNEIAQRLSTEDQRVVLVENPQRDIPIGLNLAIAASSHPVIIRVDAHSELTADYTRVGVSELVKQSAANVGGVMQAAGTTSVQQAIAAAYNSPAGLGGGAYHGDGTPGEAESAYLGIFRREAIERVGGYDPVIRRGEDWELNLRIRQAGGAVWFAPQLKVTYWPRASLTDLARQFFATGAWRAVLVRRYPKSHPWRFFVPGVLVVVLLVSALSALLLACPAIPVLPWSVFACGIPVYLLGVCVAACTLPGLRGVKQRALGFLALVTMHVCWGTGFLTGLLRGASRVVDTSRAK